MCKTLKTVGLLVVAVLLGCGSRVEFADEAVDSGVHSEAASDVVGETVHDARPLDTGDGGDGGDGGLCHDSPMSISSCYLGFGEGPGDSGFCIEWSDAWGTIADAKNQCFRENGRYEAKPCVAYVAVCGCQWRCVGPTAFPTASCVTCSQPSAWTQRTWQYRPRYPDRATCVDDCLAGGGEVVL